MTDDELITDSSEREVAELRWLRGLRRGIEAVCSPVEVLGDR
jgi:hypothetical protein